MERRIKSQYSYEEKLAVISEQINKDQFGKCMVYDTEADSVERRNEIGIMLYGTE